MVMFLFHLFLVRSAYLPLGLMGVSQLLVYVTGLLSWIDSFRNCYCTFLINWGVFGHSLITMKTLGIYIFNM
jgi:hypothetical protein